MSVRAREREFDGMTVRRAVRLRTSPTRPFSRPARGASVASNRGGTRDRADECACLDARALPQDAIVSRTGTGTVRAVRAHLRAGWRHWRRRSGDGIGCMSDGGRKQVPGFSRLPGCRRCRRRGVSMSVNHRGRARLPAIAMVLIIGVASVNGFCIGMRSPEFSPLWITAALLLNWALLSLAGILGDRMGDRD